MPARPHSKNDWLGLPAGKRGFPTYQRYKSWWQRSVAPKFSGGGGSVDYLAPMSQGSLHELASSTVKSQIDPLVKEIQESIGRRSAEGSSKLNAFNDRWFQALGPMKDSVSAAYDKAMSSEQAITGGITSFLQGQGNTAAADVSSQLQAINAPQEAVSQMGGGLATLGAGIAGQALGRGSLEMQMLNADRLAEETHQSRLPGIVRQFGAERLSDFQGDLNSLMADQIGEVNSRVPGLVSDVYQGLLRNEVEKAIARRGFDMDEKKYEAAVNAPPGFDSGFSNFLGYAVDENGNPITDAQGNPIPKYEKPGSAGKANTQGVGEARKVAGKIHDNLMKRINSTDPLNAPTGNARTSLILAARRNAIVQVQATLRSYYPDQPDEWINQKAAQVLAATGFPGAAAELTGGGPAMGTTDRPPEQKPKAKAKPKRPKDYLNPDPKKAGTSYEKPKPKKPQPLGQDKRDSPRAGNQIDERVLATVKSWRRTGAKDSEIAYRLRKQGVSASQIRIYLRESKG